MNTPEVLQQSEPEALAIQTRDAFVINHIAHAEMHSKSTVQATHRVFKSVIPSCQFVFKNGKYAPFINGRYTTNVTQEIIELEQEIGSIELSQHKHLFIDKGDFEVDPSAIPESLEAFAARIRAETIAEMTAKANTVQNMGTSEQPLLKPASTADIASILPNNSISGMTPATVTSTKK